MGIRSDTLRQWFFPTDTRKKLLQSHFEKSWLTFDDFLQAFAVKSLKDFGVKPPDVRDAIKEAKEKYNLPYPLSIKGHSIYADDHGRVHILPPGHKHPTVLTGKGKGTMHFAPVIERYLKCVIFDENKAKRFIFFESKLDAKKKVIMDPLINFGEPTVEGTPYRALTLYNAVKIEGTVEDAARIYEVQPEDIRVAVEAVGGVLI